jgi:HNH endonuclease
MVDPTVRFFVRQRANDCCEYCRLPRWLSELPFNIDHIVATQHRLDDRLENLAWSCGKCNRKKGPNLSAIDPLTGALVPIFHPRQQQWEDHFGWNGLSIVGQTPCGRATTALLDLNNEDRIRSRRGIGN